MNIEEITIEAPSDWLSFCNPGDTLNIAYHWEVDLNGGPDVHYIEIDSINGKDSLEFLGWEMKWLANHIEKLEEKRNASY